MSPAANIDRDCLRCFRPMRGSHQKIADNPTCYRIDRDYEPPADRQAQDVEHNRATLRAYLRSRGKGSHDMSTQPLTAMDVARARFKEAKDVTEAWDSVVFRRERAIAAETDPRKRTILTRELSEAQDQLEAAQRREYAAYLQIEGLRV